MGNEKASSQLKDRMPLTAQQVAKWRADWGDAHVTEQVRQGIAGKRNCFYAVEAGHVVGSPFDWCATEDQVIKAAVLGGGFVVAMRPPKEQVDGAN